MKLGSHLTDEHRTRVSAGMMGHTVSSETRAKIAASKKGTPAWNKGIPMTDEQRARVSLAHMNPSLEVRQHLSLAHLGYHHTEEAKAKISAAGIGHAATGPEYQTAETRAKMSAAHRGFLNANWQGGITPETQRIRNSPEYAIWRTAIFERDHYTCQECGDSTGGNLEAHHIHEFAKYPDERFVVDNGKTLCVKCHDKMKPRHINARA